MSKDILKEGGVLKEHKNTLSENMPFELEDKTNGKLMASIIRKSLGSRNEVSSNSKCQGDSTGNGGAVRKSEPRG